MLVGHNEQAFPEEDIFGLNSISKKSIGIRALSERHKRPIKHHLLDLSSTDRYLRFGYHANDYQIEKYVAELNFTRDEIYGVFNRRLKLIALAHLAYEDPTIENCAEFGISVSSSSRGKGLGTVLFQRSVLNAQANGVDMLFVHTLSENASMLKIVKRAGATIETERGEVKAFIKLPAQNFASKIEHSIKDAVSDQLGEFDFLVKQKALRFWDVLSKLQTIRNSLTS